MLPTVESLLRTAADLCFLEGAGTYPIEIIQCRRVARGERPLSARLIWRLRAAARRTR